MSTSFLARLLHVLDSDRSRPAVVHRGVTYTRADLVGRARRLAARLRYLGLTPGDRVALPLAEKLPSLIAQLAVPIAGGIAVPLNPRLPRSELPYFLTDSGAAFALVDPDQAALWEELRSSTPTLRHVVVTTLADELPAHPDSFPTPAPDDACLIIYSSGTTGWPKGVVHTQANLCSSLLALKRFWRLTPDDRVFNALPLFHVHGLCIAGMTPLLSGSCVHLEDAFHLPGAYAGLAQCSVVTGVPTVYYRLLDHPDFRTQARRWTQARLYTCGSAPIRTEVLPELCAILGKPIVNRYGMSEAQVITSLPLDGPWPDGSVGVPLDGVEVEVRGEEGGLTATDEVGRVWIRGPNLFRGYWNNPEATRSAFREGWFETGDLGSRDAQGFLTLVGRTHDLIITNGFNVYPALVERILNECPGVRECAVVGVPDRHKGERVAAVVVGEPGVDAERLEGFCRERLTDYQRPREIVFVESLPRNTMGKVLKRELREQLVRREA